MKALSLKLRDDIFLEVEKVLHQTHMPRNTYINKAVSFYNQLNRRKLLRERLAGESAAVRAGSLEMLREFEALDENGF